MKAERLTKESFALYGQVLSQKKDRYDADNEEFAFSADIALFEVAGEETVGILEGKRREVVLKRMERHVNTPEILFQMSEDAILFVGQSEGGAADIKDIKPFLFKQGSTVLLKPGTWHWVPFPVGATRSMTQVIFKKGTSDTDCEIVELREVIRIV